MAEIISIGNMLVEGMRTGLDMPLDEPGTFAGPCPSGDTPIYADTAARLGHRSGFIGVIGNDDFGKCMLERFQRSHPVGVDFFQGVAEAVFRGAAARKDIVVLTTVGRITYYLHRLAPALYEKIMAGKLASEIDMDAGSH